MLSPDLFKLFTERLDDLGIDYIITGSVAGIVYGEPRFTNDIDMVLRLNLEDAEKFTDAFPIEEFYIPPIESLLMEIRRFNRGHFNLIHHQTGFKADIYLEGRDPLHVWALSQKRRVQINGLQIWLAPPEYVIIRKLEFYLEGGSEKHLFDITSMTKVTEIKLEEVKGRIDERARHIFDKVLSGKYVRDA